MKYRAGIVGCGRIGSEFDDAPKRKVISTHAGAYSAVDEVELVAVCDLNKERLKKCGKRWHVPSLYQDYGEMLRKEALDILSICTWNSTHLDIVKEAVNSGVKAIFCEKPIADSLKNADEMIKLCDEKKVILQIDHQRRFDEFHQDVRSFVQNGKLGRIQQVSFYYTAGIANTGSHMFDLLRFFFGDVAWVQATYSQNKSPNINDPNIDGIVKFRDGIFCAIQACDVQEFLIFEIDCIGTKGRLNLTHSGFDVEFYKVRESELFSGYKEIFKSDFPINKKAPREFMVSAIRHLVECLKEGQKPICSGEDGRAALELICAFHESARADGNKISLPLMDSEIEVKLG
ncbi:MAG: Gfo/Idh/MocA family oxidoreductase [Dehalococcoidia bacterium]